MNIEDEVLNFIASYGLTAKEPIGTSTELRKFGLDGADAEEFIQAYATRFYVDMSDFEFEKHFGPEAGFNPFVYLWLLLSRKLKLVPITVADLVESAKSGKWSYK